ncbi:MAG: 3-deoxy-manno-octulosonate cytidylyltransferase [Alphaproteobacteria bacterium]|nr:3-deoxy-manno-octulosonate cytidylyltransferase [Alphaproteobacteria bacterium]
MPLRIIIPARYGSTRFPGKPLALVAGVPLLQRVWALGASVVGKGNVAVATDDERIAAFCAKIGAACVMTDPAIANGTGRVHAALQQLPSDVDQIINLQGDAVLTPPWVIRAVIDEMARDSSIGIFTPAVRLTKETYEALRAAKQAGEAGGTTVTFDKDHNALYFSKSIIPFVRAVAGTAERAEKNNVRDGADNPPVYRHIGLYGYRRETLARLIALPPSPLEQAEKLEQLRALENGLKIRVVEVDYKGRSHIGVDSEADASRAEAIIAAEGELLPVYDGNHAF